MSVYGRILSDDLVEDAVVLHLANWTPTFLGEVAAQCGLARDYYLPPVQYTVRADFDKFPEEMLPLVVVTSPGILDDPVKTGRGVYRCRFQINVTCVCSSIDQVATRQYANRMGAAVRAVLLKKQSLDRALDETVRGIDWIGERNQELPSEADRTIWGNRQIFLVEVDDVITKGGGPVGPFPPGGTVPDPADPDDPTVPPPDPVLVTNAQYTIEKEPVNS